MLYWEQVLSTIFGCGDIFLSKSLSAEKLCKCTTYVPTLHPRAFLKLGLSGQSQTHDGPSGMGRADVTDCTASESYQWDSALKEHWRT